LQRTPHGLYILGVAALREVLEVEAFLSQEGSCGATFTGFT